MTGSVSLFLVWMLICAFAVYYLRQPGQFAPLAFWLAFTFFYPDTARAYTSLQEHRSVKGALLFIFLISGFTAIWMAGARRRWFRGVIASWLAWGVSLYLIVFSAWLFGTVLGMDLPPFLDSTVHSTSGLKLAIPVIAAVGAIVPPLYSLRQPRDIQVLFNVLGIVALIVMFVSYVELAAGTRLIAADYQAMEGRLVAFSVPDPNSYGRMLLLPILFLLSGLFARAVQGATLAWKWGVILLALVTVLLTLSRTTYLSLTAGFIVLVVLNTTTGRTVPVTILLLVAMALAINATDIGREFVYGSERGSTNSLDTRMLLYESVQEIIRDSPIVGALPGGYFEALTAVGYASRLVSAHNMFLGVAVEWGIPMAALLVIALGGAVALGVRGLAQLPSSKQIPGVPELSMLYQAITCSGAAYLVHGITEIVAPDAVFFLLGLALAGRLMATRLSGAGGPAKPGRPHRRLVSLDRGHQLS